MFPGGGAEPPPQQLGEGLEPPQPPPSYDQLTQLEMLEISSIRLFAPFKRFCTQTVRRTIKLIGVQYLALDSWRNFSLFTFSIR